MFLKKVKDLSFIHSCFEDCPVVFASGSSNAYQDGCDHPQLNNFNSQGNGACANQAEEAQSSTGLTSQGDQEKMDQQISLRM